MNLGKPSPRASADRASRLPTTPKKRWRPTRADATGQPRPTRPRGRAPRQHHEVESRFINNAKRAVYLMCLLIAIGAAGIPIFLFLTQGLYTVKAFAMNLPICLALVGVAWLVITNRLIWLVEYLLMTVACSYVLVYDVLHLVTSYYPDAIGTNRNGISAIGCMLIALAFPARVALWGVAGFFLLHTGLFWANLMSFPWSDIHFYHLNESLIHSILAGLLLLINSYNAALGMSRRRSEDLADQALTDELTGLPNRRSMAQVLTEHHKGIVVLIDLDNFKVINDSYGHDQGDDVLQRLGAILRSQLEPYGYVGRWGGEEFLAVLPDLSLADAVALCQATREEVAADDGPLAVTCSIGVTTRLPSETTHSLLKRVDTLLYQAKNNGKDRVEHQLAERGPLGTLPISQPGPTSGQTNSGS